MVFTVTERVLDVLKIRSSPPWYTEIGSSIYKPSPPLVYNPCFTKTKPKTNTTKISKPLDTAHRKSFLFVHLWEYLWERKLP